MQVARRATAARANTNTGQGSLISYDDDDDDDDDDNDDDDEAGQLLSRLPPRNMLSRRWLTTDIQQRNLNKEGVHSLTTIFRY